MAEQQVKVVINGEDKSGPAFKSASSNVSILNKDVSGLTKIITGGLLAAGAGVTAFLYSSAKSAGDAQKGIAQLNAVLTSTHHAAGLFTEDILDQADALQRLTTYDDDAVVSASNLLLTFTNIKGAIFQQALPAILDMSTAMGQDLQGSAIQVGKALNDPIEGITALRRVGVSFTDQQQDMIKSLVESGKTMEAQKLILNELSTEFGGSAEAAANTFEGRIQQLNNAFDDMKKTIGGALIEALMPFVNQLTVWASKKETQEKIAEISKQIKEWAEVIIPVAIDSVKILFGWLKSIVGVFVEIGKEINYVIEQLARLANAVKNSTAGKIVTGAISEIKYLTGAKADGGPVMGGSSYLVGERGPEIFTPNVSGFITPNGMTMGTSINISISGNTLLDDTAGAKIARQIMDSLKGNIRI